MDKDLKNNLMSAEHWLRFFYMALFLFGLYIASFVVFVVIIAQCVFALITGSDNKKLREFGSTLSVYIKSVLSFLTYNTGEKPFPFADWPEAESSVDEGLASNADTTSSASATVADKNASTVSSEAQDNGVVDIVSPTSEKAEDTVTADAIEGELVEADDATKNDVEKA